MKNRRRMKPILLMRTRGISGPRFGKHANMTNTLSKSSGAAIAVGAVVTPTTVTAPVSGGG